MSNCIGLLRFYELDRPSYFMHCEANQKSRLYCPAADVSISRASCGLEAPMQTVEDKESSYSRCQRGLDFGDTKNAPDWRDFSLGEAVEPGSEDEHDCEN